MSKTDILKIIEYENFKHSFFINKKIGSVLDDEYSSIEEDKYGRELCKIYENLYNINFGKKYIKESIITLTLAIISLLYNIINIENIKELCFSAIFLINISVIIILFMKLMMIGKYYDYILYKYIKLTNNK